MKIQVKEVKGTLKIVRTKGGQIRRAVTGGLKINILNRRENIRIQVEVGKGNDGQIVSN